MTGPHFNQDRFVAEHVTCRTHGLFEDDLQIHDTELAERIGGASALVIGGAGSIGSSFIKTLLRWKPERLYIVDVDENGLTELTRDLRSSIGLHIPHVYKPYPVSLSDTVFEKILRSHGPFDLVANFAAHKHVRSEKDRFSIEAMFENNVFRVQRLIDLMLEYPPQHFFCVSTDKAANPANVMGATKKLLEDLILAHSNRLPVTTARFANVAFSNGSLLHGFLERMRKRQPLSSPNDVKRYFLSQDEAGQFCLIACLLGESGNIFFPKLDPSQMRRFSDIALEFLAAYGDYEAEVCVSEQEAREKAAELGPDSGRYPVYFFASDTSGEKPFEEFYTGSEVVDLERFRNVGVITDTPLRPLRELEDNLSRLRALFNDPSKSKADIVRTLEEAVPTFRHIERKKGLDQRM